MVGRDSELVIEIDPHSPTAIPSPASGSEYELRAVGGDVHVNFAPGEEVALFGGRMTVIRRGGVTVTAAQPGVRVVAGPERPDRLAAWEERQAV